MLAAIAHKMIPMLKQLEANDIAALLLPLEDGTHEMEWAELKIYTKSICEKMLKLIDKLDKEAA